MVNMPDYEKLARINHHWLELVTRVVNRGRKGLLVRTKPAVTPIERIPASVANVRPFEHIRLIPAYPHIPLHQGIFGR